MSRTLDGEADRGTHIVNRTYADFLEMLGTGRSFSGNERNCCFLSTGHALGKAGGFANVSAVSGFDFADDARGVSQVDWDHDGDLDLWVSNRNAPRLRFLRNDTPGDNGWISLRLVGNGKTTNRDGIGARVEVITDEVAQGKRIKTLRAGEGHLSQSSKWMHFGLGASRKIEKVVVRWPEKGHDAGDGEAFVGLTMNGRFELVQGEGEAKALPAGRRSVKLQPASSALPRPSSSVRIPLVAQPFMPRLTYGRFDGKGQRLAERSGGLLLINLWASWCHPCVVELKEFTEREQDLRRAGMDVLALSVNGIGEDRTEPAVAEALLAKLGFPFSGGRATEQVVYFLQKLLDHVSARRETLPIPTSFLVDSEGRVLVIYKGAVSVDQLLRDVGLAGKPLKERMDIAAHLSGRWVYGDEKIYEDMVLRKRMQFAETLAQMGFLDEAIQEHLENIKLDPDGPESHNNVAIAYGRKKQFAPMEEHLKEALRIQPDYAEAHHNYGVLMAEQGRWVQAAEHYQAALRSRPHWPDTHGNYGWVLMQQGQWALAEKHLEAALDGDPDMLHVRLRLGQVLGKQGYFLKAIDQFQRILAVEPNHLDASKNLQAIKNVLAKRKKGQNR